MVGRTNSLRMEVHTAGSEVWVRDDQEGWLKATVSKVEGNQLLVVTEKGDQRVIPVPECPLQNNDARGGVEDMTELNHLHEPGVLWNLKKRYMFDDIYTYTGNILIALNPFQPVPHLYGQHMMEMYKGQDLSGLSPHVYATAEASYRQMVAAGVSQSILVSGESGAGKTETCKLIMKYLAFLGGYAANGQFNGEHDGAGAGIESKVLESNPLLEAFGNAKTVRNFNSSRFGKFTEIQFDSKWRICGAAIRTYLLERSRVVAVNDPERNYHIFYQVCAGATPEERVRLHLREPQAYRYLNQSSCYDLPGLDNAKEYLATRRAMGVVGIRQQDQEAIFTVVAAVLHLGNTTFTANPNDDNGCLLENETAKQHLIWAAELLGVSPQGLHKALTTKTIKTPEGPIVTPITAADADFNRNSLAKTIYARLFDYLVEQINQSIGQVENPRAVVGVLDIYGFEQFQINDFEQFCINLANEKLQQHFNQHVFKMEQAEYEAEEIDWTTIEFVDNQDVLDLIEKKPLGMLDTLDEACRFQQSTATTLAEKFYANPEIMNHRRFSKPRRSNTAFIIDHYAGKVEYQVDNFLDKNKDFVVKEHQDLLAASSRPLVAGALFKPEEVPAADPAGAPGKGRAAGSAYKFVSVGSQFKKQLAALMDTLATMEPHYVRCIKPNSANCPSLFENVLVLQQLRCGGVLEAVRISCAGYPSRRLFFDFVEHFWHLAPDMVRSEAPDDDVTMAIVQQFLDSGYAKGRKKIFLKGGQMAVLEKHRTNLLNASAIMIQKHVRGHLQGGAYRQLRRTVIRIQALARMAAAQRLAQRLRYEKATLAAQTAFRGARARRAYLRTRAAVLKIQSAVRGKNARLVAEAIRRERAAITLQRYARGAAVRSELRVANARATVVQCLWRRKVARRKLRTLRAEARESGKLLQDKERLEGQLKEMQGVVAAMQSSRADARAKLLIAVQRAERAETEAAGLRVAAAAAAASNAADLEAQRDRLLAENAALEDKACASSVAVQELKTKVEALQRELTDLRDDLAGAEDKHKAEVNRLRAERERSRKEAIQVQEDLLLRLQNACSQRDEAREQVLALEAALESQRLDTEQRIAAASKVAEQTALHSPATPPHGRIPAPGALPPADGSPSTLDRFAGSFLNRGASLWQGSAPSPTTARPGTGVLAYGGAQVPGGSPYETELDRRAQEMQRKQQVLVAQQRNENQDTLVMSISQPLGFDRGRPVAAVLIFRCCVQWKVFEMDRTNIFDRIITTIGEKIEPPKGGDVSNVTLCYWLSNTVTLLLLLQKNLKPAAMPGGARRLTAGSVSPASGILSTARAGWSSYFGKGRSPPTLQNHGDASIHGGGGGGGFRQIGAKYPALLFKQQLDACMGKVFPMLRDNIKKDINTPLAACIHMPRGSHRTSRRENLDGTGGTGTSTAGKPSHWEQLLAVLDALRAELKANYVPPFLQRKLFVQLFSFINVQLFNQLLLRRECCSFANGEYVKNGLAQVEHWVMQQGDEVVGGCWDELRFIRQAVAYLVLHAKQKKTLKEIQMEMCPELSVQQLYRISTMYWDDKFGTETVSGEVLQQMRHMMQQQQGSMSHSFLLDDDSSNPFNANDMQQVMDDKPLYTEMTPPEPLRNNPAFEFLYRDLKLPTNSPPAQ